MPMSTGDTPVTLLDLLSNSLVLEHTAPLLPLSTLFCLGATSKSFHSLISGTPQVFRNIDLSVFKKTAATPFDKIDSGGVYWHNQQNDESITEEEFYSGPLRGIFGRLRGQRILQNVHTLNLDGLSVPAEIINEIISDSAFNVRLLSIREAKNLNEHKLMQALRYAVRPLRPGGTPRLKGLYVFGPKDAAPATQRDDQSDSRTHAQGSQHIRSAGVTSSIGAQIGAEWNHKSQRTLTSSLGRETDHWYTPGKKIPMDTTLWEWAKTLQDCHGSIAFDAVLCRGPRHATLKASTASDRPSSAGLLPLHTLVANVSLSSTGCESCHGSPEGPVQYPTSPPSHFPLFAPPPLYTSDPRVAQTPPVGDPSSAPLYLRCEACLLDRFCERCHKWWCEDCYAGKQVQSGITTVASDQAENALADGTLWGQNGETSIKMGVSRDCIACGRTCRDCQSQTSRYCRTCGGGYCIRHNEGSSATTCDWCNTSGRRTREMY